MRILLVVGVVSLLAGFGVSELFVRAFIPAPRYAYSAGGWQRELFQHDPLLGWRGRPFARSAFGGRDFLVDVSLDERGYRSSVPPQVEGRRSYVALGDSNGWGWGVGDGEVWTERMMELDPELNVYNLATPGWATDQEYLDFRRFLEEEPGLALEGVLLLASEGDFEDVRNREISFVGKPWYTLEQGGLMLHGVPTRLLDAGAFDGPREFGVQFASPLHRLHVANLFAQAWHRAGRTAEGSGKREARLWPGMELVVALTLAIRDAAAERGAPLRVVVAGPRGRFPWWEYAASLEREGIPVMAFERGRLPATHFWLDGHLEPRGHRRLARNVVDWLAAASGSR